jgi:predicted ArsR family transcriptional regulator
MTVDEIILKALEGGPVTVNAVANELAEHFLNRVRVKLEKLRVRGIVLREGRGGAHRQYTYRLLRPDQAAMALCAKGGGLSHNKKAAS